ncbi:MAG: transcriptional regulator [Coxiella sp. RIFCSPHIGHO2_12_FULL_42_15]|nr:MAG: transcriptional regulator [Coxiella sp. RIFCSPHIGHO2_12_FULL_42_15]
MALTKDFKSTIMARARKDKKFCEAMLAEAIEEMLSGDVDAGKAILRDYINATITFDVLSKFMDKNPKSIMRMLSTTGNPTSKSIFMIFHVIQKLKKVHFEISVK